MDNNLVKIDGIEVGVEKGSKSANDFKVKYRLPGGRERTPKHIHLIIDILLKRQGNRDLTNKLVKHLLDILSHLRPISSYPPKFQYFKLEEAKKFDELNRFGEYKVEFLLAIFELIMIQEVTNYPTGKMNRRLFERILEGADIFSLVSAATFR